MADMGRMDGTCERYGATLDEAGTRCVGACANVPYDECPALTVRKTIIECCAGYVLAMDESGGMAEYRTPEDAYAALRKRDTPRMRAKSALRRASRLHPTKSVPYRLTLTGCQGLR